MAEITALMVKELREKTGAGMMECKKALQETGGDLESAIDELRKRGQVIAQKKGARAMKEGRIFARVHGHVGVLVELNCETDFVARNAEFAVLGEALTELVASGGPEFAGGNVEALTAARLADGTLVSEALTHAIAKLGENHAVTRYARVDASEFPGAGAVAAYVHPPGKLGVLIVLEGDKPETLKREEVVQLGRDLAMQVAAAAPVCIDRTSIPAEVMDRERAIYQDQARMEGKPEKIWDKIVEGKMTKFYKQACLVEQEFVKNPDQTIQALLAEVGRKVGGTVAVRRMQGFVSGEMAETASEA